MIIRERTKDVIVHPKAVNKILQAVLASMSEVERDKEHFFVFGLDARNQLKFLDISSTGTLNYNLVHPREVFRLAILKGCAAIIVSHNHPSGNLEPSDEDLSLTRRMVEAGKLLGIEVMDHVIVGDEGFTSLKMEGHM
jgi:DNA repair protein RadC